MDKDRRTYRIHDSSISKSKIQGVNSFIDPFINPTTRVAKARLVMANSGNMLKPEMFVTGMLSSQVKGSQSDIVVTKSAVLCTGERSVVFVKSLNEKSISFAMREVTLAHH